MADDPRAQGEIEFNYEKSQLFRVVHVDGVVGGFSPSSNLLHVSVFSERTPIPKKMVFAVSRGVLGEEKIERREVRTGVFREVEADLVMSIETVVVLRNWLTSKIEEYENIRSKLQSVDSSS